MSDKDTKLIDLSQKRQDRNKVPEPIIEELTKLIELCQKGELKDIVLRYTIDDDDEGEDAGTSLGYVKDSSFTQAIGSAQILVSDLITSYRNSE